MKNRDEKKKDYEALRKALENANNVFVNGFEKMTVDQDYNLRKVVREAGGKYRVLKNKLAARAAKGTNVEAALQGFRPNRAAQIHPTH